MLLRLASTIVLIPPALAAIWFGSPYFEGMVLIVGMIAIVEWCRVSLSQSANSATAMTGALFAFALALQFIRETDWAVAVLSMGAGLLAYAGTRRLIANIWPGIGLFYVGFACLALIWLRGDSDAGRDLIVLFFAVVWATDIGAYVVGRILAGPKLAPAISPKKTWSGAIGGAICGAAIAAALTTVLSVPLDFLLAALGGAGLSVAAQIGDLFESWWKRRFGVKDSGHIIPGHGGVLDRVDGVLLAAPVAAVGFWFAQDGGGPWK